MFSMKKRKMGKKRKKGKKKLKGKKIRVIERQKKKEFFFYVIW